MYNSFPVRNSMDNLKTIRNCFDSDNSELQADVYILKTQNWESNIHPFREWIRKILGDILIKIFTERSHTSHKQF